jgi:hypothetical protein
MDQRANGHRAGQISVANHRAAETDIGLPGRQRDGVARHAEGCIRQNGSMAKKSCSA